MKSRSPYLEVFTDYGRVHTAVIDLTLSAIVFQKNNISLVDVHINN